MSNDFTLSALQNSISTKVDLMNGLNLSIDQQNQYASNEALINEVSFSTIELGRDDSLESHLATLWSIGSQCPLAGGPAVYRARALLKLLYPALSFDDQFTCIQGGYVFKKGNSMSAPEIEIFPNPTTGKVKIKYNLNNDALVEIFDILGHKLKSLLLFSTTTIAEVDLSFLENGIYQYRIVHSSGMGISNGKIIIEK